MVRSPFILGFLIAGMSAAAAQTAPDGWNTNCQDRSCVLSRRLVEAGTDRPMATFLVVVADEAAPQRLAVAIPLGVALAAGLRMSADDTVLDLPFEVCLPDGCRAAREATAAEIDTVSSAETANIRFFAFSSNQQLSVDLPLDGLAEAVMAARSTLGAD